jgi:hypothetical protein
LLLKGKPLLSQTAAQNSGQGVGLGLVFAVTRIVLMRQDDLIMAKLIGGEIQNDSRDMGEPIMGIPTAINPLHATCPRWIAVITTDTFDRLPAFDTDAFKEPVQVGGREQAHVLGYQAIIVRQVAFVVLPFDFEQFTQVDQGAERDQLMLLYWRFVHSVQIDRMSEWASEPMSLKLNILARTEAWGGCLQAKSKNCSNEDSSEQVDLISLGLEPE